ncbi:DinB family protein [Flavivirga sp. 57AJ16]|uniref:DinB family protein n=1 Tax=Flavivirga sp. 57AJ16 TaxID=3025307 RepID=UPI00236546B1|nr:DinB family protein [Flavivirga sp. 57AJ16]MDD7886199.1 DinB family protein [Flavivirga sp. 57AJ16]
MTTNEILIWNFKETRRRSEKIWENISPNNYHWKPDDTAMSIIEMVRHVLEGEHLFHKIIEKRGNLGDYETPWKDLPYKSIEKELEFAKPYRESFMNMIKNFNTEDFESIIIKRTEVGQKKILGDYLNRIAYHEAVHCGQMLSYLRILQVERPLIWD